MGRIAILFVLAACSARAQIPIKGPNNVLLVFQNVSFGPGVTHERRTRIFGTVTNATGDFVAHAAIKVQFFDNTARVYPRPSITCSFTTGDLVPGEASEIGEKQLRAMQDQEESRHGLTLKREPIDCNAFLRTLNISSFSLEIISVLTGTHVLTTVRALSRLNRETTESIPWDLLRDEAELEVLEFVPGRADPYRVRVLNDGRVGYVEADKIVVTPQLESLKRTATESASAIRPGQSGQKEVRLRERYGPDIAARILEGRIWIGMTRDMAIEMLGTPEKSARKLLFESVHDEWSYGSGLSLFFDNGILTGYQQDR